MPRGVRAFTSPDQLEKKLDEYFAQCLKDKKPATYVGMAVYCGVPKRTLFDYSQRPGYAEVFELAKERIEEERAIMLLSKAYNVAGVIFDLCNNFGWINPTKIAPENPEKGFNFFFGKEAVAEMRRQTGASKQRSASASEPDAGDDPPE